MWYHACKELADRLNLNAPLVDGFVLQYEISLCSNMVYHDVYVTGGTHAFV